MATAKKQAPAKGGHPDMDTVLTRMLNTPPSPFTPPAKPKAKKAKKRVTKG